MNKIFQHTHMHDHVPIKIQFISINLMLLFTFFSPPINCDLCRVQSKQQPKYKYEQTENWFEKCTINQKCEKLHSCLFASDERKFAFFVSKFRAREKKNLNSLLISISSVLTKHFLQPIQLHDDLAFDEKGNDGL